VRGSDPLIQLQMPFGGGKSHAQITMRPNVVVLGRLWQENVR
jgi:hypothetical protein